MDDWDSVQRVFTIALSLCGVLTPIVIAAGVRDRALHNRIIASEKALNDKIDKVAREARDGQDDADRESRDHYVRNSDFTAAISRIETSQRESREETKDQISMIHADIRNLLTTLARMESKRND